MALANHLVNSKLCFSNNDVYLLRYEIRFLHDPHLAFCKEVFIDIVVSIKFIMLDQLIDESFALTVCQVRLKVGGDIIVPYPYLTLNRKLLLCPTHKRIMGMHYTNGLVDYSCLQFDKIIQSLGFFVHVYTNYSICPIIRFTEKLRVKGEIFLSPLRPIPFP